MAKAPLKRDEIHQEFKWQINDIFTDESWKTAYDEVQKEYAEVVEYKGKICADAESLKKTMKLCTRIKEKLMDIYVYAGLKSNEDAANSFYKGRFDQAMLLYNEVSSALSFIDPEILLCGKEKIMSFIDSDKELETHRFGMNELFRATEHILSEEMEQVLAMSRNVSGGPKTIFETLNNADMKYGTITDENGEKVILTNANYGSLLESKDRRVRKEAFETKYAEFIKLKNTIASIYSTSIKSDIFYSKVRKYESALHASLFGDDIKPEVYKNLIDTVHEFLPYMHRYMAVRKKRLGVDELHMYDICTPIIKDADTAMPYEKAKEHFMKSVEPLGADYVNNVSKAFTDGWIDVYPNEGKSSGAYQWGTYSAHPYVSLNYDDKLDDMFTLAHELGHAMHSFYSNSNQDYDNHNYPIFLAEVASTLNEALMMEYMLKTSTDKSMKEYLINHYLEQFRGTLFRQTMFAEFEMIVHAKAEQNEPLTVDVLSDVYRELNKKYHGPDMISDEEIAMEWARIPHFYRAFYVYKYATGFSCAIAFSKRILEMGEPAVEQYLGFLKSGGSASPLEILKKAGVDMSSPEPIKEALSVFAGLVEKMENL